MKLEESKRNTLESRNKARLGDQEGLKLLAWAFQLNTNGLELLF
jgi:hypothetical protein